MTHIPHFSRRRFCLALGGLPVLAGCSGGQGQVRAPRNQMASRNIAVLLPLSGPRAALGQKMAKSVWLAEDLSASTKPVRVMDAGNSADSAAAAATEAVAEGADVLIGPLFREQTGAVLQVARDVPVLSLSNDSALANQGAWVFGVTPAQSVDAVLRFAKGAGGRRITSLETTGVLGARAQAALASARGQASATLLPPVPAGTAPADMPTALRQAGGGALPDIVYVPSASAPVLEQALAAVGTGVTTIGSLQWSGLPRSQFIRLDKACFTGPDPQRFDRLSARFRAQLDEEMGVIGALAIDAVAYAQAIETPRRLTRRDTVSGLLGETRFLADRTCARALSVLRIAGGGVVRVA